MAKLLFFIGPGGAGKSTICKEIIKRFNDFKLIRLDDFAKEHKNDEEKKNNIEKLKMNIQQIEKKKDFNFYLIDVGGYSQTYVENSFWESRKNFLICIYNNENFCYENFCNRPGKEELRQNRERFIKKEFEDNKRIELYRSASIKITTNKSIEENTFEVLNFILKRFYGEKQ